MFERWVQHNLPRIQMIETKLICDEYEISSFKN